MKTKKLLVLHPPFYETNYAFYDEIGQYTDLSIFMFGDQPKEQPDWHVKDLYKPEQHHFRLRCLGKGSYPFFAIYSASFLFAIRKEKPDVLLTIAFAPYSLYAGLFAKLLGYRFYLFCDSNENSESKISIIRRFTRRIILSLCQKALSPSPATTAYLKKLCPSVPVEEIAQVADVSFYSQKSSEIASQRPELRREFAQRIWQQKQRCLSPTLPLPEQTEFVQQFCESSIWLGVGRFITSKRWEWGLKLLQEYQEIHYVLVGKGPLEKTLQAEATERKVLDRFHLMPFTNREELANYYNSADMLYFPAHKECFGFVIAEALASNCPVLCSSEAGASILITEHQNGWCDVEGPNLDGQLPPERIAQIIQKLPSMRQNCSQNMKDFAPAERAEKLCHIMELL